jgi:excisionase family DNA binding protein
MPHQPTYSITQTAKLLGVTPDTLRRWEDQKIVKPKRNAQNNRVYSLTDLANLKTYLTQTKPRTYSVTAAAKTLKVSPSSIRRWEREGRISSPRTPGGHRRYSASDLKLIQKQLFVSPRPLAKYSLSAIGTGAIPPAGTQVLIENPAVLAHSKVFITPTLSTSQVITLTQLLPGQGFIAAIAKPTTTSLSFNWWLIN